MALIKAETYRKEYFLPGEAPDIRTIRRAIDTGELPGKFLFGKYWVSVANPEDVISPLAKRICNGEEDTQPLR